MKLSSFRPFSLSLCVWAAVKTSVHKSKCTTFDWTEVIDHLYAWVRAIHWREWVNFRRSEAKRKKKKKLKKIHVRRIKVTLGCWTTKKKRQEKIEIKSVRERFKSPIRDEFFVAWFDCGCVCVRQTLHYYRESTHCNTFGIHTYIIYHQTWLGSFSFTKHTVDTEKKNLKLNTEQPQVFGGRSEREKKKRTWILRLNFGMYTLENLYNIFYEHFTWGCRLWAGK